MGFFDELKNRANQLHSAMTQEMNRFKNREMMEAILAGCALVASADGTVSSAEKQKMIGFIQNSEALKVFQNHEIIQSFQQHMAKMEFDYALGQAEALQMIGKIKQADQARLLVRVCCAIGNSDGEFDEQEKAVVRTICRELQLNPADFDL
ncbi:MAG: tellurite resistance TerB family protein [Magnetococcales bacterium]|nr:tellurite resistance TerB family protein [Magnetococcales bacterium]